MADQTMKIGFIGTGGRAVPYARHYVQAGDMRVAALADPSEENRQSLIEKAGLETSPDQYTDWEELLRQHTDLDGVVIASPNFCHVDQAVACLERGLPVALEKPLATTKEDCERILEAEKKGNAKTLLGFVLRSAPFYVQIHDLIQQGAIGRVVSVQADELVGAGVTSLMNRSPWRRLTEKSGGAMLEKCCHDLDILNWVIGARPLSLCSYGGNLILNPDESVPAYCYDCEKTDQCVYYQKPKFSEHEDEGEETLHQYLRQQQNRCIYNVDKDVLDVQNACIQYETGAVANFLLNFHAMGPKAGRNFHAVGTKGRIWGNAGESQVFHYDNLSGELETYNVQSDGSGHGGGDRTHTLTLRRMIAEPDFRPDKDASAGYMSAVMCFACDWSTTENRSVDFEYLDNGLVNIV